MDRWEVGVVLVFGVVAVSSVVEWLGREALAGWAFRVGVCVVAEPIGRRRLRMLSGKAGATVHLRYRFTHQGECLFVPKEGPPGRSFHLAGRVTTRETGTYVEGRMPAAVAGFLVWMALMPWGLLTMEWMRTRRGFGYTGPALIFALFWLPMVVGIGALMLHGPMKRFRADIPELLNEVLEGGAAAQQGVEADKA